ncbi:hypothetical protein C0J52_01706 [Blattella germanica]|nr:hypothetical protein C0J52_01706 [Blattella germanica]
METDWTHPPHPEADHQQLGLYCHQPHQMLQQQVCELSLAPQSIPPPPLPPQPQMALVQSSWWPVVDVPPNGNGPRLPWPWIPCMESAVETGHEPEIEPEPDLEVPCMNVLSRIKYFLSLCH